MLFTNFELSLDLIGAVGNICICNAITEFEDFRELSRADLDAPSIIVAYAGRKHRLSDFVMAHELKPGATLAEGMDYLDAKKQPVPRVPHDPEIVRAISGRSDKWKVARIVLQSGKITFVMVNPDYSRCKKATEDPMHKKTHKLAYLDIGAMREQAKLEPQQIIVRVQRPDGRSYDVARQFDTYDLEVRESFTQLTSVRKDGRRIVRIPHDTLVTEHPMARIREILF